MSSRRTSKGRKRLTPRELRPILRDYQRALPGWRVVLGDTLVREDGPIAQGITLERLSWGDYRIVGYVHVLAAPCQALSFTFVPKDLGNRLRTIDPRLHDLRRDEVVEAIRQEFVPSVDRPLEAEEALQLCERDALPTSAQAHALAGFNAYLEHSERALDWCHRFPELVNSEVPTLGWRDFDHERMAFLEQLRTWLARGTARSELERVVEAERRKLKLV